MDQVYTAIYNALRLVLVVLETIDSDDTIYPHYFSRRDKAKVKAVYQRLAGTCDTGNIDLSKLSIQQTDIALPPHDCDDSTLACTASSTGAAPIIVICDYRFKKKAFTKLNGAQDPENDPAHYLRCRELVDIGHVNSEMQHLGSVLLHEYMHFEMLVQDIYQKPLDDQLDEDGDPAYGPVATYDNLNKNLLARVNIESYRWYALQVFWSQVCDFQFQAPRERIDTFDPDCPGNSGCRP